MIIALLRLVDILANLIVLLVIVDVLLGYFLSPYQPVRHALDRIIEPMLNPIRRVVPLVGMFDLSPVILIILVEIVRLLLVSFLNTLVR